jgi:hypothetical protein
MKDQHISEEDIQLFVLDNALFSPEQQQHFDQCGICQGKVNAYKLLFTSVETLPKSSFDFDVVDLVMPVLPEQKKTSFSIPAIATVILLAAGAIALPVILFDYRITGLWKAISPWMISLVLIVSIALIGISLTDMYTRYRRQMQQLNFK